jgi:hypothetical protein
MKLFNLDSKYDRGFSLDTSVLSKEQLEHFYAIINARGITQVNDAGEPQKHYARVDIAEQTLGWYTSHIAKEITYPELCRGSIQLKPLSYCVVRNELKVHGLLNYADLIQINNKEFLYENGQPIIRYGQDGYINSAFNVNITEYEISPEEFEAKLKGIYPVVRENRTTEKQSANNAQCKPT